MLDIDAYVTEFNPSTVEKQANFSGDIEVFNDKGQMEMQIEGMNVASFAASTKEDDRELYLHTVWNVDPFHEITSSANLSVSAVDHDFVNSCNRIARFYLSNLDDRSPLKGACTILDADLTGSEFAPGSVRKAKSFDTPITIDRLIEASTCQASLHFLRSCGKSMPYMIPGILDQVVREGTVLCQFGQQVQQVVKQIAHRYPRMKILEIASDGTATMNLLQALGSSFASYTFAAVDDAPLENFFKVAKNSPGKLMHLEFDVHQDALDQGYIAESYDLVITSYTLRKARSMEHMLSGIRRIIRPGGYLLALDSRFEMLREKFTRLISGRSQPSPQTTPIEWSKVLGSAGFGRSPETFNDSTETWSLTVCQSTNEGTEMLHKPLDHKWNRTLSGNILIIGGLRAEVKTLVQEIVKSFKDWKGQISTVDTFETIVPDMLDTIDAAIILADLDQPIVMSMNEQKLQSLQGLFRPNRKVLWLVSGFRADSPYHNASVGMGRCIKAETPNLDLQFLDLDKIEGSSTLIAEAFFRLMLTGSSVLENQLWTTEHELAIENSKILIPRILPVESPNGRLNSIRRVVTREVSTWDSVVGIRGWQTHDGLHHTATEVRSDDPKMTPKDDWVKIRVNYSSLLALKFDDSSSFHVCLGRDATTGKSVIALTLNNLSTVNVPSNWVQSVDINPADEEIFLELVAGLIAGQTMMSTTNTGKIILYEPDDLLVLAIRSLLPRDSHRILCFTSRRDRDETWVHINPQSSTRRMRSMIPPDTTGFFDLSTRVDSLSAMIKASLPSTCCYYQGLSFFQPLANGGTNFELANQMTSLRDAAKLAQDLKVLHSIPVNRVSTTSVGHIIEHGVHSLAQIADWKLSRSIPVSQTQVDPSTVFSNSRTYLLVGLTGELGQSLCKLMVLSGVRYIVLASRNPNKTPQWRNSLEDMGAQVRIEAMDVTNLDDVERLRDNLAVTMPPIAGVVNGAMVLSDSLFADMSLDSFEKVLAPKARGSLALDRVFSSSSLDFFVMFSSLTAVAGNRGQSNYAAANMVSTFAGALLTLPADLACCSIWLVSPPNVRSAAWQLQYSILECYTGLAT